MYLTVDFSAILSIVKIKNKVDHSREYNVWLNLLEIY